MAHASHTKALIVVAGVMVLFLVDAGFVLTARTPDARRRSHFWLRLPLCVATMPALLLGVVWMSQSGVMSAPGAAALDFILVMLCIPALILIPGILTETPRRSSGGDNSDDGQDDGPDPPPPTDDQPRGDLPLPGADLGRWRVRDHLARTPRRTPIRRPAPEPDHERAPAPRR